MIFLNYDMLKTCIHLNEGEGVNEMKMFKTTALAVAVMASFSANAELASLNDEALDEVTGQEGITIVVEAQIKNLDVAYTDNVRASGGAVDPAKGGTLGLDGISTDALVIKQTVDIVDLSEMSSNVQASVGSELTAGGDNRALAMSVDGIKGTFTVGAVRIGKDKTTAIGDATLPTAATFDTGRAKSLGAITLGNLETNGGITQYIYAH